MVRTRELLKQRTMRSPINGIVVERTLGPGNTFSIRRTSSPSRRSTRSLSNPDYTLPAGLKCQVRFAGLG
jgi:hypothetical protein